MLAVCNVLKVCAKYVGWCRLELWCILRVVLAVAGEGTGLSVNVVWAVAQVVWL